MGKKESMKLSNRDQEYQKKRGGGGSVVCNFKQSGRLGKASRENSPDEDLSKRGTGDGHEDAWIFAGAE